MEGFEVDGVSLGLEATHFMCLAGWEDYTTDLVQTFYKPADPSTGKSSTVVEIQDDHVILVVGELLQKSGIPLVSKGDPLLQSLQALGMNLSYKAPLERFVDLGQLGIVLYLESERDVVESIAIREPLDPL